MSEEKLNNRLTLRIDSVQTMEMLNDIDKVGAYRSRNEIINRALDIGIPALNEAVFGKKLGKTQGNVQDMKDLQGIKNILVQQSITLNVLENLLSFLYNVEVAKADGVEITSEFIESGCLEQLPENIAEVKKEMTKAEYLKLRKKNNA